MPFPLEHTKGHQAATDMMDLRPLGACLTACQAEWVRTHADHLFELGANARQPPDFRRGQCHAVGGLVLGAVSDDHALQIACQPAPVRPGGMPSRVAHRVPIESAILLQAAHEIPPIVVHALAYHL